MKARIKVVDVETTCVDGDPDWVHPANTIVMAGVLDPDLGSVPSITNFDIPLLRYWLGLSMEQYPILMVGHNLMFDIGHMVKAEVVSQRELAQHVQIWDTMVAEYILSGQAVKFTTLEELAARYGIPFKKNVAIVEHMEAGHGAIGIPIPDLSAYLTDDLTATYAVFLKQYAEADSRDMLPLIYAMMDFRLATIDMRLNGINVDPLALKSTSDVCDGQMSFAKLSIEAHLRALRDGHTSIYTAEMWECLLDPLKPMQLASMLFGGEQEKRIVTTIGVFKNLNPKTKVTYEKQPYNGLLKNLGVPHAKDERSVDEDSLDAIIKSLGGLAYSTATSSVSVASGHLFNMLQGVQSHRKAAKILSTYVQPSLLDSMRYGNKLYPTVHVTTTNTGRTSCARPNLQNVPKESIGLYRKAIVAPKGRKLVEFDYKQLEVVALAVLTGDPQLVEDLKHGVDMHSLLFEQVHGFLPDTDQRTDFKRAVFCLIYGGGQAAVADQGNCTLGKAALLIQRFRIRYPETQKFRDTVLKVVDTRSVVAPAKYGIPHRVGVWSSPTNRVYRFEQRIVERKDWKAGKAGKVEKVADWSKQEIANYPIQGTATADMVPLMIGMLYRYVYGHTFDKVMEGGDRPRLLMPVHDSVVTDVAEGTLSRDVGLMGIFLETLPKQINEVFDLDCRGLPFKVGVSAGDNWEEMQDYKGEVV